MANYPHAKQQAEFYALIAEHGEFRVKWREWYGADGKDGPGYWTSAVVGGPPWRDGNSYEFEVTKQTGSIHVDGLPLPETQAPDKKVVFFLADPTSSDWYFRSTWTGVPIELEWLDRGLIYLNEYDAVTVAKAMRVTGTS